MNYFSRFNRLSKKFVTPVFLVIHCLFMPVFCFWVGRAIWESSDPYLAKSLLLRVFAIFIILHFSIDGAISLYKEVRGNAGKQFWQHVVNAFLFLILVISLVGIYQTWGN